MPECMYDQKFIDILIKIGLLDSPGESRSNPKPICSPADLMGKRIIFQVRRVIRHSFRRRKPYIKKMTYSAYILGVTTHEELAMDKEGNEISREDYHEADHILLVISPVRLKNEAVRALKVDMQGVVRLDHHLEEVVEKYCLVRG